MARKSTYIFMEESHPGRSFLIGVLLVLLLAAAALVVSNFAINNTVTYTREDVTIPKLPSNLENWTILHLSDLNGQDLGSGQSAIRTAIGTRSYSCVVMSGNMVGKKGDVQPVLDLVALLPRGTPILLLPGDSDPPLYTFTADAGQDVYAPWARALMDAGVTILDEPVSFQRRDDVIWFTPEALYTLNYQSAVNAYQDQLDALNAKVEPLTEDEKAMQRYLIFQLERMARIQEKIGMIGKNDVQIAVTHMPLSRDTMAKARAQDQGELFDLARINLVLSGGYCGGQWRIPGVGALYVPELGWLPEDDGLVGMTYLSGVWQHISPGLGASSEYPFMPFRLFNGPGAALIVLTASMT